MPRRRNKHYEFSSVMSVELLCQIRSMTLSGSDILYELDSGLAPFVPSGATSPIPSAVLSQSGVELVAIPFYLGKILCHCTGLQPLIQVLILLSQADYNQSLFVVIQWIVRLWIGQCKCSSSKPNGPLSSTIVAAASSTTIPSVRESGIHDSIASARWFVYPKTDDSRVVPVKPEHPRLNFYP